jgi:hypothetical protein
MLDIKLGKDGDIELTESGDISLTDSVRQAVLIRLRWILGEWRLGPEFGFPWFEDMFVKKPNFEQIKTDIREQILSVDGVTKASVDNVVFDAKLRRATFTYTVTVNEDTFTEEVEIYG